MSKQLEVPNRALPTQPSCPQIRSAAYLIIPDAPTLFPFPVHMRQTVLATRRAREPNAQDQANQNLKSKNGQTERAPKSRAREPNTKERRKKPKSQMARTECARAGEPKSPVPANRTRNFKCGPTEKTIAAQTERVWSTRGNARPQEPNAHRARKMNSLELAKRKIKIVRTGIE